MHCETCGTWLGNVCTNCGRGGHTNGPRDPIPHCTRCGHMLWVYTSDRLAFCHGHVPTNGPMRERQPGEQVYPSRV